MTLYPDPEWHIANAELVSPMYIRRVMRNYQIRDTAELHELIMTTRVNWIVYQRGGQMNQIQLWPRFGHSMEISAQTFHAINWYLSAHTTIPPFLTPEHGMMQRQSGNHVRKIGKIFLMPENEADPDYQNMVERFRDITERLKLKQDFFEGFFRKPKEKTSKAQQFASFCLKEGEFLLKPMHPLGYSYGGSCTRYARSRST